MNKNITTISLPAKPQSKSNIGLMIAPLIMEVIGKKIRSKKVITLNTLHTYHNVSQYTDVYLNELQNLNIKFDKIYEDSKNVEQLLSILKELINNKTVIEKEIEMFSCQCGQVEFIKNGLCFADGKLYSKINGHLVCNNCLSELKSYSKKALVINYSKLNESFSIIPKILSNEMNYFVNLFEKQDILISKNRNTGNFIKIKNTKYNIDIEFIWSQLYGINYDNKIMIASNHQTYVIFMMNMLNRLYNQSQSIFILTPYINNNTKFDNFEKKIADLNSIQKKLFLFYSLNWKKKTCSWNFGTYKKIKKLSLIESAKLFDLICKNIEFESFNDLYEKIDYFFTKECILDRDLLKIKEPKNIGS